MIAAVLLAAGAPAPAATLGEIRAQLFYEQSGTFSGDIARPGSFAGWNTVIGEGPAKEAAQDVLVTVPLAAAAGAQDARIAAEPLLLRARDGRGRTLASRTISAILIPWRGQVWSALWLRDATCAGKVTIDARLGGQTKRAVLALDCGE